MSLDRFARSRGSPLSKAGLLRSSFGASWAPRPAERSNTRGCLSTHSISPGCLGLWTAYLLTSDPWKSLPPFLPGGVGEGAAIRAPPPHGRGGWVARSLLRVVSWNGTDTHWSVYKCGRILRRRVETSGGSEALLRP